MMCVVVGIKVGVIIILIVNSYKNKWVKAITILIVNSYKNK
jgi:hypothetical protein